jgi:hypothetical protein
LYNILIVWYTHETGNANNAIMRVHVNQDELKLNSTYQLLVYADDVNIFWGSILTVIKNADALVVACKVTGLEVNADKTKYVHGHVLRSGCKTKSVYKDW